MKTGTIPLGDYADTHHICGCAICGLPQLHANEGTHHVLCTDCYEKREWPHGDDDEAEGSYQETIDFMVRANHPRKEELVAQLPLAWQLRAAQIAMAASMNRPAVDPVAKLLQLLGMGAPVPAEEYGDDYAQMPLFPDDEGAYVSEPIEDYDGGEDDDPWGRDEPE